MAKKEEASLFGVSFTAANRLVERLAEVEILEEATGNTRNRVFRYSAYIGLFSEN